MLQRSGGGGGGAKTLDPDALITPPISSCSILLDLPTGLFLACAFSFLSSAKKEQSSSHLPPNRPQPREDLGCQH